MTKKNKIIFIISIVVVILFPIIMALIKIGLGTGDWKYELKNNYQIWRANSKEIIIGKEEDGMLTPSINENNAKDLTNQDTNITMGWIKTKPAPKDAKYE